MNSWRERRFGRGMRNVVAHVSEERALRFDAQSRFDGVRERGVRGMRFVAQGVEKKHVEILQFSDGGFGDFVMVREIGNVAKAEAVDFFAAMHHRDRLEAQAKDFERCAVDQIDVELRDVRAAVLHFEGVGEDAPDGGEGVGRGVDGDGALAVVEGTHVIHSKDVVGVTVGIEDGVEAINSCGEHLGAEVGRCIDEDVTYRASGFAMANQDGGTETDIARVGGMAHGAGAANRGYARTGAGTQNPDRERHLGGLMFRVLFAGLNEAESQLGDGVVEAALLFARQVAFGLFLQHGEKVDVVAAEVEIGPAFFGEGKESHVEFGLEAQGVDQKIEIGWRQFGAEFVIDVGVLARIVVYFTHDISLLTGFWQWAVSEHPECYIWTIDSAMVEDSGSAGQKLERLIEIMARLRAPDGCPWDREQSFDTIKKFTVEETYEVLDAIDRRDWAGLREELGDYLLQAVFYAQMASEEKRFSLGNCLDAINEKLVRRHPHIFGDETARTGDEVLKLWEAVKTEEKRGKGEAAKGMLDAIPRAQPALIEAQQISSKAARAGFDWANAGDVIAKLEEEIAEFREAHAAGSKDQMEDELGDLLFTIVNLARFAKVDPEQALRRTNAKFRQRFGHVEGRLAEEGAEVTGTAIDRLEALWQEAKK